MFPSFDPISELLARRLYVLVKCGRDYRVPYLQANWNAIQSSGEYPADFAPFLERFLEALRSGVPGSSTWPAGSYFPGGWYRVLKARGQDVERVAITPEALGPFYGDEIRIDLAGVWTVGRKVITGTVLAFFLRVLQYDPDLQRYVIRYDLETHVETRYVHHESLPFRVVALEDVSNESGGPWLHANDGRREPLRWDTLRMDAQENLYCAFRSEGLPAQFADGPRFRLLDALLEGSGERGAQQNGEWLAHWGRTEHRLTLTAPWTGAASLVALPPVAAPGEAGSMDDRRVRGSGAAR